MTPQLEAAIAVIKTLSSTERQQLFHILVQSEANPSSQNGLREKDGVLVFDTESLDHIDFNALIAQSREERDLEQVRL
ncbi:MAG: hypothetical protein HC852_04550 [Acaryochloridaceae cyanobacterium RU_4_10]|nr:hypothetical protein [Acaryochloridaceae cyanobacterium RU_4_10]